jgi:Domain of unknown function (DUF4123)
LKETTQALIRRIWAASAGHGNVYAILDTARDKRIYPRLRDSSIEARCLYEGPIAQPVAETAPYLVQMQPWTPFTELLFEEGWGHSWGIFLSSSVLAQDLRRHLRRFLMVADEQGKQLYFRYYDPRVFRVYLPTCTEVELKFVFGPVERFWCESEDGREAIEYARRQRGGLEQRPLAVVS